MRHGQLYSSAEDAFMLANSDTMTRKAIAEALGRPERSVDNRLQRLRGPKVSPSKAKEPTKRRRVPEHLREACMHFIVDIMEGARRVS